MAVAGLTSLLAGVALWLLTDRVSKSDIAGDGWSLGGNGALIVPCIGLPAVVAVGWALLWRGVRAARRRGDSDGTRGRIAAMVLVPVGTIAGMVLANAALPAYAAQVGMARVGHAAVRLPNGDVLVSGGVGDFGSLATAARFDPSTRRWRNAGAMAVARSGHSATVLADGRVLVAGGCCSREGAVATDELYDPSTNSWASLPGSALGRMGHTAFALTDGRVLALGGGSPTGTAGEVALFDAGKAGWTSGPPLLAGRVGLGGALLSDGRVLAAGDFEVIPRPAELFDPSTGLWRATSGAGAQSPGPLIVALSDGRALAVSRREGTFGGAAQAELYDPTSDRWRTVDPPLGTGESAAAVALPAGRALFTGGTVVRGQPPRGEMVPETELFDPMTGAWSRAKPMRHARSGHTATLLADGRVLVVGGATRAGPLASAELFDPGSGDWETLPDVGGN